MLHFKNMQDFNNSVRSKTIQQVNQLRPSTTKLKSKYSNKKTEINGTIFDSKKEAKYYLYLLDEQKKGEISNIELQPVFILQDKFRHNGKGIRAIEYRADFAYIENGKRIVVDVKGFQNKIYLLKKKMLLFKYPDINFIET